MQRRAAEAAHRAAVRRHGAGTGTHSLRHFRFVPRPKGQHRLRQSLLSSGNCDGLPVAVRAAACSG